MAMNRRELKIVLLILLLVGVCCVPRAPIEVGRVSGPDHIVTWIDREIDHLSRSEQQNTPPLISFTFLAPVMPAVESATLEGLLPFADSSPLQHVTLSRRIPRAPPLS